MGQCSLVAPDHLAQDSFGRLRHRRVSSYSFGLSEGAGQPIGDGIMGYKIATRASFETKRWRRWITSSWAAFSARKCDQHRSFRLRDLVLIQEGDIMVWWTDSRRCLPKLIRRGFDSLFFLIGWTLWKERNARTFNGTPRSVPQLLQTIEDKVTMWIAGGYRHLGALDSLRCAV
jgi:hypothetical protein